MIRIPDDAETRDGDPLWAPSLPPQCGWLSPDGRLAPCIPWGHGPLAADVIHAMGISILDIPMGETHDFLWEHGWIKIARKSRSNFSREGGRFAFETPKRGAWTPEQLAFWTTWSEIDAVEP